MLQSDILESSTYVYDMNKNSFKRGPDLPFGMKLHCMEYIKNDELFISDGNRTFILYETWKKVRMLLWNAS